MSVKGGHIEAVYNMGWGDPVCVREALLKQYKGFPMNKVVMLGLGYPPAHGVHELVEQTRALMLKFTGIEYKHIIITPSATSALNNLITLYGGQQVETLSHYFPYYKKIIEHRGKEHVTQLNNNNNLKIVASPNNPTGIVSSRQQNAEYTVWDAAYHSPTYTRDMGIYPAHDSVIMSFGKLLGLPGLRLGAFITNDDSVARAFGDQISYGYDGVSALSQWTVSDILNRVDLDKFFKDAREALDKNRSKWSELSDWFNAKVPYDGMFWLVNVTEEHRRILAKAKVSYVEGINCGGSGDSIRLNLAQSNMITQMAVEAITMEICNEKMNKEVQAHMKKVQPDAPVHNEILAKVAEKAIEVKNEVKEAIDNSELSKRAQGDLDDKHISNLKNESHENSETNLEDEKYTVVYKAKKHVASVKLSKSFIQKRGLEDKLEDIKNAYMTKLRIEYKMHKLDPLKHRDQLKLRLLSQSWGKCECRIQELYGFKADYSKHRFWQMPHCTCAEMDNKELWGMPQKVYNNDCPIHGS